MSNLKDRRDSPRRPIGPQTGPDWVLIAFVAAILVTLTIVPALLATIPENGGVP